MPYQASRDQAVQTRFVCAMGRSGPGFSVAYMLSCGYRPRVYFIGKKDYAIRRYRIKMTVDFRRIAELLTQLHDRVTSFFESVCVYNARLRMYI